MPGCPSPKPRFQVEWRGTNIGFSEVSGLDVETEVVEYSEGSSPEHTPIKTPRQQKFGTITMKRGVFKDRNGFHQWWITVKRNTIEQCDLTISLMNKELEPEVVWKVKNARPTKIQPTDLKADDNEAAIDTIELVHEGVSIENE